MSYCEKSMITFLIFLLIFSYHTPSSEIINGECNIDIDPSDFYAVVVAVDTFETYDPPIDCYTGEETVTALVNSLINFDNWDRDNIKLLVNENATKQNIHDSITIWLDDRENENDIVLFYIVAHGTILSPFKSRGAVGLYPYDASSNNTIDGLITDIELDVWLDKLESKNVMVIIESCHAGGMKTLSKENRVIICSAGYWFLCVADEDPSIEMAIFTYHLLKGITNTSDTNSDGWISIKELFTDAKWPTFFHSLKYCLKQSFTNTDYLELFILGQIPQLPFIYDEYNYEMPLIQL